MAPTNIHHYEKRAQRPTFTTFFLSIACGIIIVTLFAWVVVLPWVKKKYSSLTPSRGRWLKYPHHTSRVYFSLTFPSYRRQLRTIRQREHVNAWIQDPRGQLPFPAPLTRSESYLLPTWTPSGERRPNTPNWASSQSLFTPVRNRDLSHPNPVLPKSYTLPKVKPSREQRKNEATDTDFGDARDYILAVPEPLRIRSQTLGYMKPPRSSTFSHSNSIIEPESSVRAPRTPDSHRTLSRQLLAHHDLHPNKLFAQLRAQDHEGTDCNCTDQPTQSSIPLQSLRSVHDPQEDHHHYQTPAYYPDEKEPSTQSPESVENKALSTMSRDSGGAIEQNSPHNASVAAMHRLGAYRSLVGAPPPQPLARAGTITRPKTPVAKMRDLYDRSDKEATDTPPVPKPISRQETLSTFIRTLADSSEKKSMGSTAKTSAPKESPVAYNASSTSLVPTPLKIDRDSSYSASASSRRDSRFKEDFADDGSGVLQQIDTNRGIELRNLSMAPSSSRHRPPPLSLAVSARLPALQPGPANFDSPFNAAHRGARRPPVASSTYSCDTLGISLARTPASLDFPSISHLRPPLSPCMQSTIGAPSESDKGTETSLLRTKQSSQDVAKDKVEQWDVDGLDFNTSPSSSFKRALSILGPECRSTHDTSPAQEDAEEDIQRYSAISTEINADEARLSSLPGPPLRISDTTEETQVVGSAPGGAVWF